MQIFEKFSVLLAQSFISLENNVTGDKLWNLNSSLKLIVQKKNCIKPAMSIANEIKAYKYGNLIVVFLYVFDMIPFLLFQILLIFKIAVSEHNQLSVRMG